VAGNYATSQSVTISTASTGATLHYAVNSTPTCSSTTYTSPVTVSVSETLEAIGCQSGYTNSSVASAAYVIGGVAYVTGAGAEASQSTNSWTFGYTASATNNALAIFVQCHASTGTISSITLSSPGWTISQLVPLETSVTSDSGSLFGAVAPNTSASTFTVTFNGVSDCNSSSTYMIGEFTGNNPGGGSSTFPASNGLGATTGGCTQSAAGISPASNNNAAVFFCLDAPTATSSPWNQGATNGTTTGMTEYQVLSGGSGVQQNPAFTSSGLYIIAGTMIAPKQTNGTSIGVTVYGLTIH
jgi:hypothetical protein